MIDFKELLVLKYLNDYEDQYTYLEIKCLCNFSTKQLKNCLDTMGNNNLIVNANNELRITESGREILKDKGLLDISINDLFEDKVTLRFIESPLKIGDIYIPEKFNN